MSHQHERRWLILALIGIAQLMIVLDVTIVNIALPSAQADLGFSDDARQWIITAYSLAFGSMLLLGGRLGDLFGRKWAFIGGLIGFSVASAIGGAADSFGVLVSARALQGLFGALLAPSALGLLTTTFTDPAERGKAFGIFGAIAGGGAAVGLLLGGILTEVLSWRWCLYVNLIFALPTAFVAWRLLVNAAQPNRPKLDIPGTLTASLGLFALVYGFSNSEMNSWGHPVTIIALAAAVVLLSAFAVIESRVAHPLLPLRVIADRVRGGSYLAIGISGIAMFAVFLFLTYFMQLNKGFTPIQTGLGFLPMTAVIITTATLVNVKFLAKVGPRPLLVLGMTARCAGDDLLGPAHADVELRHRRAPRPADPRLRHGQHLRPGDRERHVRRRAVGQRRRLGDGQHDAAGRRLDRHRAAELDLRQLGRGLRVGQDRRRPSSPARRPCTATRPRSGSRPACSRSARSWSGR